MKRLTQLILILTMPLSLFSQTHFSSPYSRYGLGELSLGSCSQSFSMGGLSYGFRSSNFINPANPASFSAFDPQTFNYEGGVSGRLVSQKTTSGSATPGHASLQHMLFGFRFNKWWAGSFGLMPFSSVGYKMSDSIVIDSVGKCSTIYEGDGGINRLYFGHAFKLTSNLSIGVNLNYLFGSITQTRKALFDSVGFYDTRITNTRFVSDLSFNAGIQYRIIIKNDLSLVLGAVYGFGKNLNATESNLGERIYVGDYGFEYVIDTVSQSDEIKGSMNLPQSIGGGFTLNFGSKLIWGADVTLQNWSGFTSFGESDSLSNSIKFNTGLRYQPDESSKVYTKKMTYMLGFKYNQTYLQLRGTQLNDLGISFGIGFPIRRSSLQLGFELGSMGTTDNQLIREKYIKAYIGVSISERWFMKRKYD